MLRPRSRDAGARVACAPVVPSVGPVLILASFALPSAPLRVSRSATALEQGRGHDRLACVFILHPPRESGTRDARALVARATSCDHSCHFSHLYSYCSSVQASFDAMLPAGGWPAQTCSARRAAPSTFNFVFLRHALSQKVVTKQLSESRRTHHERSVATPASWSTKGSCSPWWLRPPR